MADLSQEPLVRRDCLLTVWKLLWTDYGKSQYSCHMHSTVKVPETSGDHNTKCYGFWEHLDLQVYIGLTALTSPLTVPWNCWPHSGVPPMGLKTVWSRFWWKWKYSPQFSLCVIRSKTQNLEHLSTEVFRQEEGKGIKQCCTLVLQICILQCLYLHHQSTSFPLFLLLGGPWLPEVLLHCHSQYTSVSCQLQKSQRDYLLGMVEPLSLKYDGINIFTVYGGSNSGKGNLLIYLK